MTSLRIFVLLFLVSACKFNEAVDPNAPLPPHAADVAGLPDTTAFATDTLFDRFVFHVPQHFMQQDQGILPGAGVGSVEMHYWRVDSSASIAVSWANRKRKGGEVVEEDLEKTRQDFTTLISNFRGASVGFNDYVEVNGTRLMRLEADLNWEGYRRRCTWLATIEDGRLLLIDAKYPLRDSISGRRKMDELLQSFRIVN